MLARDGAASRAGQVAKPGRLAATVAMVPVVSKVAWLNLTTAIGSHRAVVVVPGASLGLMVAVQAVLAAGRTTAAAVAVIAEVVMGQRVKMAVVLAALEAHQIAMATEAAVVTVLPAALVPMHQRQPVLSLMVAMSVAFL